VTYIIILLVLTWHTNKVCQVFSHNLTKETELLFWHTPRTFELFFIPYEVICNLSQS
jgi:hypothetical protein